MLRLGATLPETKERLIDYMCSAPRSLLSQDTTYVCNVLLRLLRSCTLRRSRPFFQKTAVTARCRWLSSGGLDAHYLRLACLTLRIYKHALLDSGILFYIPHFTESESKQSLPASCPAAVCSAFSKMAHNLSNVHCPSSPPQNFEFATNVFCAFETSPLGEGYINYCSFPLCFAHQITTVTPPKLRLTCLMAVSSSSSSKIVPIQMHVCVFLDLRIYQFSARAACTLNAVFYSSKGVMHVDMEKQ